MKILLAVLFLTGCNSLGYYHRDDIMLINENIIKKEQAHCADAICESSESLDRPEVVMRLLSYSLNAQWETGDVSEFLSPESEKGWSE